MMSDDFARHLETYLEDYQGATPLPDFIREAVRAEVPNIKQVRPLSGLRRYRNLLAGLPAPFRYAAVAAALAAFALGLALARLVNVATTPSPTPAPIASPQAIGPATGPATLEPGSYLVADPFAVPFTLGVSDGWHVNFTEPGRLQLLKRVGGLGSSYVPFTERSQGPSVHDAGRIGVYVVTEVYRDPCKTSAGLISPAPVRTVDGLSDALTHQAGIRAGPMRAITIGGMQGKRFDLRARRSAFRAACDRYDYLFQWTHTGSDTGTGAGVRVDDGTPLVGFDAADLQPVTQRITILDVRGTVVLIEEMIFPQTTPAEERAMDDMVASIRFE